jgi:two-component system, NarL family, sensor histidine kinase DesK
MASRATTRAGWLSAVPRPGRGERGQSALLGEHRPSQLETDDVRGGTRLARAVLVTVLCGFFAVQVINVATSPLPVHGFSRAVGYASAAIVFALQLHTSSAGAARWPIWRRAVMLVALGLVTYLPLTVLGLEWGGMAGFFAGSILLLVPGWPAWALFGGVAASMFIYPILQGTSLGAIAYLGVSTIDIGLIVFGLSRLSLVVQYLKATRGKLARLAIANERMRFARDLHDLLGYSLSAITLKVELTRRLVTSNPGRARDEIAEVLDIARQALADVRLVASGYRNFSLEKEASAVASLLPAAGIATDVQVNCGRLDERVDTVLATVLREAVTNTLRHSTASNCCVEASQDGGTVRLQVVNDGVSRRFPQDDHEGGLSNMATRLAAIGGTITAGIRADGRFEVIAEAPARPIEDGGTREYGVIAGS